MASPVEAHLILCDAAVAEQTGKLHMLGAGWTAMRSPIPPHAVAIMVKIPWDRANQKIHLVVSLLTGDGKPVQIGPERSQIRQEADIEVGRPPGIAHGTMLPASLAINVPPLQLPPGRYEWRLEIAETQVAESFQVIAA